MIDIREGDFERFLKFANAIEVDIGPSRRTGYQPLNSPEGFRGAMARVELEDIPLVLVTRVDTHDWFTAGSALDGQLKGPMDLHPTSRAYLFLDWLMRDRP